MTECHLSDSFKDICDEQNGGGGGSGGSGCLCVMKYIIHYVVV